MVAQQELALTGRAPASPVTHHLSVLIQCLMKRWSFYKSSPSQEGHHLTCIISRRLGCVIQHVAQYSSHVVPFLPHCAAFLCQSLSIMSVQVLCTISHCTAVCSVRIQLPGMFSCIQRREMLFLSLPFP